VNGGGESRLIDAHVSMRDRHDYLLTHPFTQRTGNDVIFEMQQKTSLMADNF